METMQTYNLIDAPNKHGEIFDQAAIEPVLLTQESQPSYVIFSVELYEKMINQIQELEDRLLLEKAKTAINESQMVGTEAFTSALESLANGET
jgi:PHD/YefM family antitoxin component YafN of YafNO toxin-antitoxin module